MQQIIEFMVNHWPLWVAFIVLLALIIRQEIVDQVGGVKRLSPADTTLRMNHDNAVIVDLRDQSIYAKGHIIGAENLPYLELKNDPQRLAKYKQRPVILACQTGQQSLQASNLLRKEGFERVDVLKGGVNAWREANMPLVKG